VDSELEEAWTLQATTSHPGALAPALTAWLCKRYGWVCKVSAYADLSVVNPIQLIQATDAPPSGKPQVPPIAITPASNAPSKHDENKSQSSRARHLQFTRRRAITETSGSPRAAQPKASVSTVSGLVSPRSEKVRLVVINSFLFILSDFSVLFRRRVSTQSHGHTTNGEEFSFCANHPA